ncbi:membrane protein [Halomonas sp. BC04]|uniref:membrane protein n=1 Tax=Halomonas sp. BC04 TaxID=1403540 RepID=UPI0003ED81CF|nr:membrane protein [Halomonas sp. BC04]EWH00447.1 membrane protein [Halomonas sp. BC04]
MRNMLMWITSKGPTVLAFGCISGLLIPSLADLLRPAMPVMVFIFLVGTLLRVDNSEILKSAKNLQVSVIFPLIFVVACPYVIGMFTKYVTGNSELALAIALATACPPSSGNSAVARMLGLDPTTALVATLCSMAMVPLTGPLILHIFADDLGVSIDPYKLALRLTILLVAAEVTALLIRKIYPSLVYDHGLAIDGVVILSLFIFACGTMSGIQAMILENPMLAIGIIAFVYGVNFFMQIACGTLFVGNRYAKVTIGLTAGNRNVGLLWSMLGLSISPTITFVFALSQLPIYTMPKILQYVLPRLGFAGHQPSA